MAKILFIGDIVGRPGRQAVKRFLAEEKVTLGADIVIANGENSAGGIGIDLSTAAEIYDAGVDFMTSGNHIWSKKEIYPYLDQNKDRLIRPINFPETSHGVGWAIRELKSGLKLGIVNAQGRVFMTDLVNCPFLAVDAVLNNQLKDCDLVFVDFHAEATSEKIAMGYFLDGRVNAVVGTHTHVQTADERIYPKGTAFITDVGMCGPLESVIGVRADRVIERFITALPARFEVAKAPPSQVNAVVVECEPKGRTAISIERIRRIYPD